MTKDELIVELRAALSWKLAKPANNPAFQAVQEMQRDADPAHHINKLGIHDKKYSHLFNTVPTDEPTVRALFKKFRDQAATPYEERGLHKTLIQHGSLHPNEFKEKIGKRKAGKYARLTHEFIDTAPFDEVETELILFIFDNFKQR